MQRHDGIGIDGDTLTLSRDDDSEVAHMAKPERVTLRAGMPADVREVLITCWAEILFAEIENTPELPGDSASGAHTQGSRPT